MKTSSRKAKGRSLQQWTRDQILAQLPHLEPDDVRSTPMGSNGEDLQLSPRARQELGVSIECKSRAAMAIYGFYAQAEKNSRSQQPLLVVKQNRSKPLAIVDAEWLISLLSEKTPTKTGLE
jgi:hypothetical protein